MSLAECSAERCSPRSRRALVRALPAVAAVGAAVPAARAGGVVGCTREWAFVGWAFVGWAWGVFACSVGVSFVGEDVAEQFRVLGKGPGKLRGGECGGGRLPVAGVFGLCALASPFADRALGIAHREELWGRRGRRIRREGWCERALLSHGAGCVEGAVGVRGRCG
jgi:hypothetical protein